VAVGSVEVPEEVPVEWIELVRRERTADFEAVSRRLAEEVEKARSSFRQIDYDEEARMVGFSYTQRADVPDGRPMDPLFKLLKSEATRLEAKEARVSDIRRLSGLDPA